MEQPAQEKIAQDMPKSCSTFFSSISPKKEGSVETLEENFSSPTPVKNKEPSRIKSKEDIAKLPEKYGALLEFFGRMTSSLRLLCLRKRTPNFQNISSQVEILTGRKFMFTHLAQMKYILPEAVQIDKILIHDEKTKCMKPNMKIALLFDVVKDHNEESVYVALSKLFSSRLREFYITHPEVSWFCASAFSYLQFEEITTDLILFKYGAEGSDVPEATLPEPFSQKSITIKTDSISEDLSTSRETKILNLSHFPPSLKRHFYQKAAAAEMDKTLITSPVKSDCEANREINEEVERLKPLPGSSSTLSMSEITPVKLLLGSDSVLVETPVLSTPMRPISPTRSMLTCEDDNKMTGSQNGKQSTSSAKKSLDFYGMDDQDTSFSRKQSFVCLSNFVFLIHSIFQSVNFCPITKEELVQKIIMNNFEFDDRREVEMQMENLEKLVPDWFCKKLARSGDLLYSVKKVSDLDSIRERVNVM